MSVSEESTITLYKTLNTSFMCSTISLLGTESFIVNAVENPRPVRTIDVHGNEGEIQHKLLPDNSYISFASACTYIPTTKTVVFTDRDQHTVYMCNITSGEGHVIKNDKIHSPTGVCAGPAGTVFVCSCGTNSVVQLSPQGEVLATHSVNVENPWTVRISRDGTHLALSNGPGEQSCIKLFCFGK